MKIKSVKNNGTKNDHGAGDFKHCAGRYALVAGRFNRAITDELVQGATEALTGHGIDLADIDCKWVPGAFEMPMVAKKLVETRRYMAVIALGAVIRGATAHFDFVAGECARGIAQLNLHSDIPIIFGVLTTDTVEQAVERADTGAANKGADYALAALEMVSLLKQL
ncbi:6,7-dimethyl-8-ribityllumazine synthase [Candidatus Spongiihabitans sp.]|uniref:6,7-dimethyl-8-ribityllumazine synthase n=1 Tax=Candidatus Spongiihabitans sp. TaxID=3101308 RepID=UPI003C7DBA39